MYCYFEFKLCCLKNLKLFSIRVNELPGTSANSSAKKGDRFLLFLKVFS